MCWSMTLMPIVSFNVWIKGQGHTSRKPFKKRPFSCVSVFPRKRIHYVQNPNHILVEHTSRLQDNARPIHFFICWMSRSQGSAKLHQFYHFFYRFNTTSTTLRLDLDEILVEHVWMSQSSCLRICWAKDTLTLASNQITCNLSLQPVWRSSKH